MSRRSLNNLADLLYNNQGRYADAEPLYKRALAICEKALGPDHPDVAASLNDLAALYSKQGRYADAEPLIKRALAIREKRSVRPSRCRNFAEQSGVRSTGAGSLRRRRAALQAGAGDP